MLSSFWRRLSVAFMLVLLFTTGLIGAQTVSHSVQTSAAWPKLTHNPTCNSGYGGNACIWSLPNNELKITWSGPAFLNGGDALIVVQGAFTYFSKDYSYVWGAAATHTEFIRLPKPDYYYGFATLGPTPYGQAGKYDNYGLIVPQVGNSNLKITTGDILPAATVGVPYTFRLSAHGGCKPYSWIPLTSLPKGLRLKRTGPDAGTITGTPLKEFSMFPLPFVARDKVGHSALLVTGIVINP